MNKKSSLVVTLAVLFVLSLTSASEARIGGGRSSGFRGSRGFAPRTYQTTPGQNFQQPGFGQNHPQNSMMGSTFGSRGFGRSLMGGIAGGFLGSMLFKSLGYAGTGTQGEGQQQGGFGIFELMVIAGLGFLVFRMFSNRRAAATAPSINGYGSVSAASTEADAANALRRYNTGFDLSQFKDARVDDFLKIQNAWSNRDLAAVQPMLAPELRETLDADIGALRSTGRMNRIGSVAVRDAALVEAWQESGSEFATLRFRASLLDYTLDEASGEVVAGDKAQPVRFEENWTFVRAVAGTEAANPWKLTAIEA